MRLTSSLLFQVSFALLFFCSVPIGATNPTSSPVSDILGRWDISFRSPQVNVDTVWVIEPGQDGATSIGTLGDNTAGLAIRDVSVSDGVITFSGTTSAGALVMKGKFSTDRLEGNFKAGPLSGTYLAIRRADTRSSNVVALFDEALETFAASLVTTAPLDENWQSKRAELRAGLLAPTATERDMVRAVRSMLSLAKLSHNGYFIEASSQVLQQPSPNGPAVTWRRLEGELGYIRISRFSYDPAERDRLDQAFADLANTSGLVIDLTENPGGDLGLAMRLGDHLLEAGTNGGLFATRKGIDEAGVPSMDDIPSSSFKPFDGYETQDFQNALSSSGAVKLVTGGRASSYKGKVALLIDRSSASSAEATAALLSEAGRARLFGARSAGKMLSSRKIPQSDGYVLRMAYADFRTPNGAMIEGVGVQPDEAASGNAAAALTAAVNWLSDVKK